MTGYIIYIYESCLLIQYEGSSLPPKYEAYKEILSTYQ